jgi:hydroxymethylglutaryl-CoA reductase (NADPH)
MTLGHQRAKTYLADLITQYGLPALAERLRPKTGSQPAHVPGRSDISLDAVESRWTFLGADDAVKAQLLDSWSIEHMAAYAQNIEHFIGTVKVPIGLAGPLRINGLFAQGDYYVPVATSEASMVASYSRGAILLTESGGASVGLLSEGVTRAPMFAFDNLHELGTFVEWALSHLQEIEAVANATTRFGKLQDIELSIEGTKVYFQFIYSTGDAAGQNMVTIATYAAVDWIVKHSPVRPRTAYLEGNFSGDKKASALSFERVRGRKVVAEATLPAELVKRWLHVEPAQLAECARIGTVGAVMSGTLGTQAHFANGLAGLFLACGQDVACVSEAAVGITDIELTESGDLHACVTLPNLIVGTVGGGTKLPSQSACLELLGVKGAGGARAFAEIAAALCLAGELSLIGAIAAGEFAAAHARRARGKELKTGL